MGSQSEYLGTTQLEFNESLLPNYNNHIAKLLLKKNSVLLNKGKILDFGAGIGTLAKIIPWDISQIFCYEIDENLIKKLRADNFVVISKQELAEKNFDFIYSSNVLEHIEDDLDALTLIHKSLKPGGCVAIYVPAFNFLYSGMDEAVGHFRRYRKSELSKKLSQAGFKNISAEYVDSLGFFASILMKIVGYGTQKGIGSPRSLEIYDRWIFPISTYIDSFFTKKLFGKNLVVWASN